MLTFQPGYMYTVRTCTCVYIVYTSDVHLYMCVHVCVLCEHMYMYINITCTCTSHDVKMQQYMYIHVYCTWYACIYFLLPRAWCMAGHTPTFADSESSHTGEGDTCRGGWQLKGWGRQWPMSIELTVTWHAPTHNCVLHVHVHVHVHYCKCIVVTWPWLGCMSCMSECTQSRSCN